MRELRRLAWAAAITVTLGAPAFAQQQAGGTIGTAANQTVGSSGTTANTNTAGQSGQGGTSGGSTGTGQNDLQLSTIDAAPVLTKPSKLQIGNTKLRALNLAANDWIR